MKHLLKVINNNSDYESGKYNKKPRFSNKTGRKSKIFICYKINGYWFRLSRIQWSEFRGITVSTIRDRTNSGKSVGEILGFVKIEKKNNFKSCRKHYGSTD